MPDGQLQSENVKTLQEIGAWLKTYGESIYGTRGGPVTPRPWGVTTQRGNKVYVHILDWMDERLVVPVTSVQSALLMKNGAAVQQRPTAGGTELTLPRRDADEWDQVVTLEMEQ
jgi:alpha-L-fucosidase